MSSAPPWEYLHLGGSSGYSTAARRTVAALRGAGVDVRTVAFRGGPGWGHAFEPERGSLRRWHRPRPGRVVVAHLMPEYYPQVVAWRPGAVVVGHTAWETDRLPSHWPALMDGVDLLVVPSQMNRDVIAEAGVTTPVVVIPHPRAAPAPPVDLRPAGVDPDAFTCYVIADWTVRKNVTGTVRAVAGAFGRDDGVQLVVKTSMHDGTWVRPRHPFDQGTTPRALARVLAEHPQAPPVALIVREQDDDEIAALHAAGDCYVSLCRGEGWGIGAFDAAARGVPVVTTGWGGHLDYLAGSSLLVDHELVDAAGAGVRLEPGHRWAEPSVEHAVELIRGVRARPEEGTEERARLAAAIHERCSPAAVAAQWIAAVPGAPI